MVNSLGHRDEIRGKPEFKMKVSRHWIFIGMQHTTKILSIAQEFWRINYCRNTNASSGDYRGGTMNCNYEAQSPLIRRRGVVVSIFRMMMAKKPRLTGLGCTIHYIYDCSNYCFSCFLTTSQLSLPVEPNLITLLAFSTVR